MSVTRFKPGQSGNPSGRPLGTRNRFSESFVSDVAATWATHGADILEKMAVSEPARFAELCGRLIPRDVSLTVSQRPPGGLEAEDWGLVLEIVAAVKAALPAGEQEPGSVMAFVLEAIRAHSAKPLIPGP